MPPALRILYCDDQSKFRDEFRERYLDAFRVEEVGDLAHVLRTLEHGRRLPDLLLLDLYHPRGGPDDENLRRIAEERLADLEQAAEVAKVAVDRAYAPAAIELLAAVRSRYTSRQLPVLVYTRRGLLFLADKELREIAELEGDWLLKDFERIKPPTEALVIRQFVRRLKAQPRLQRDVALGGIFTAAGGLIGVVTTMLLG